MGGKLHAKGGCLQRAAVADEERLSHPRLELRKRPRQRGLRQPKGGGALADAAGIDNGRELDEVGFRQFHNDMVY